MGPTLYWSAAEVSPETPRYKVLSRMELTIEMIRKQPSVRYKFETDSDSVSVA